MKIDVTKLKDKDLFMYFTHSHPDKEVRSLVQILPLTGISDDKTISILKSLRDNTHKLVAVYDRNVPSGASIVGAIPDGTLYLVRMSTKV